LRWEADHQARLAQKQFSPSPDLLLPRLRQIFLLPRWTERRQVTAEELRYYKSKEFFVTLPESPKTVTRHIDIVQARNGFIHLLDYKPKARTINPVNQLVVYAVALASRTRRPVKVFKCAWFDEKDYFKFFRFQAIKTKNAQPHA
jgi:hypothetical protein